jgi:O-glycosyl hydrolase
MMKYVQVFAALVLMMVNVQMMRAAEIRIDPGQRFQTMEGFGASGAWWAQAIGDWPEEERREILRLLFDREEGAGLTIYRYNIGAGGGEEIHDPWRRAETFEVEEGVYDWSRDAAAIRVLREVRGMGVERFVFFANSPPARMTKSGMASGGENGGPNLSPERYGEFARYLLDITQHWKDELDLPQVALSPINEPQWTWGRDWRGQEGCHFTAEQARDCLKVVLEEISRRGDGVELEAPELARWGHESSHYVDVILGDEALREGIASFGVHSYWSGAHEKEALRRRIRELAPEMPVAMTEWTEMRRPRETTMDSALLMARVMHEDLTLADAVSWQKWIAVSKYDYRDGLIYVDVEDRAIIETRRLWVMGNYSRFVRPGAVRVLADAGALPLRVVGFVSEDGTEVVVVVVNDGAETVEAAVLVEGQDLGGEAEVHVTDDDRALSRGVVSGDEVISFGGRSVTTVVLERQAE